MEVARGGREDVAGRWQRRTAIAKVRPLPADREVIFARL
jgi:hypothetical protein